MNYLNRKLGSLERLFDILHDLGGSIVVNVARIEGLFAPEIIQKALDLVQQRHPMLQVHIVELTDGLYFQSNGTSKIPLIIIDKQQENQWIEVAEEELHRKLSGGTAPLCRVTFLRSSIKNGISEIIVTFNHAITDGISCMRFIDELLSYCQQIANGDYIPKIAPMELLPSLENMLSTSLGSQTNIGETQENHYKQIHPPTLIIEREASPNQRRTHLVTRILSKEMTILLINRCKQEKTTVQGALCAAMLFSAAKIASTDTPITLSCGSNVNLRKFCEPEVNDEHIGFFVSRIEENHTLVRDLNFWDLARECKSRINYSLSCKIIQSYVKSDSFRSIDKNTIIKASEEQMGRNNTLVISNLGKINFSDEYANCKLKEVYFTGGQHVVGACFWLGVVTFHEQLFCSFTHVSPLISSQTAELFADSVIEMLKNSDREIA